MPSHPLDHVITHAGYRFEFYHDHTKVFALDDPTGMPLEAFPAVVDATEPGPAAFHPRAFDIGKVPDAPWPRCTIECDPGPEPAATATATSKPFTLWPTASETQPYLIQIDGQPVSKEYWDGFQRGRKTAFAQHDSDDLCIASAHAAERTLQRLGYTWSGGKEWKPPIGKRPEWLEEQASATRVIDIGDLHKRLERVERILHENGVREA